MKHNVDFIGLDVDGAAFLTMELMGQKVEPKSIEKLSDLIAETPIPFIIKGIMTIEDARAAREAGAAAIVVSNHGGRITENHPSSISVLPAIVREVSTDLRIIFDGGVRSGEDIYKALALGADLVMVGRPFSVAVMGAGTDGVKFLIEQYRKELEKIMILTGVPDIQSITAEHILLPALFATSNMNIPKIIPGESQDHRF
jgi:4-hydroxymandelate oxidase